MLPKTPLNCYPATTSASNIVVGALCHYQVLTTAFATVSFTTPIIILHHDRHSLGVAIVAYHVFPLIFTRNVGFCLPKVILTHKSRNQFCGAYIFCCLHYLILHEGFGREERTLPFPFFCLLWKEFLIRWIWFLAAMDPRPNVVEHGGLEWFICYFSLSSSSARFWLRLETALMLFQLS